MRQPTSPPDSGTEADSPRWWVVIERDQDECDLAIGPYPTEPQASLACQDSLLVESLVAESCTECYVTDTEPDRSSERILIDLDDPDHTGVPVPD